MSASMTPEDTAFGLMSPTQLLGAPVVVMVRFPLLSVLTLPSPTKPGGWAGQ